MGTQLHLPQKGGGTASAHVFWPDGWMDEGATWYGGRPRPWPHCIRLEAPPWKGNSPPLQFFAHVCCGQTAWWIKMPLGREVDLGPGNIVLDGDPASPKGHSPPSFGLCLLWPNGWMDRDATWYGGRPRPGYILLDGDPAPPLFFGPCLLWPNGRPSQLLLSTCFELLCCQTLAYLFRFNYTI